MAKPELGTKRTDPDTGRKFFDLNRDPIVSPYTGKSYPLSFFESGASRSSADEEEAETETAEIDETPNTVSLSEVEDDEEAGAKDDLADVDVDVDDDDDTAADDTFLEEDDDDDDDMNDIIGGGRDDDDDV